MSSSPPALMYAELLSNIRQVSVIAALQIPSTKDTTVVFSDGRRAIKLVHNGATTTLVLPAPISDAQNLVPPALGSREISWRFPLPRTIIMATKPEVADTVSAPWSAEQLSETSEISCRKCGNIIAAAGSIRAWKDLPSENWAEMMDFWHCHKPDVLNKANEDNQINKSLGDRGYGANSRFIARSGVGFVDLTYFLLSGEDCHGVKLDTSPDKPFNGNRNPPTIHCEKCHGTVGAEDQIADGFRLYKWSLSVQTTTPNKQSSYPVSHFITALLLSQISAQAISKFVLHSTDSDSYSASTSPAILYIWVFAPYLTVSFSAAAPPVPKPILASKIFYRKISALERGLILQNASMSTEEVRLPTQVMTEVVETLRESTLKMPESARRFREWEVGLLERFVKEKHDQIQLS